MEFSTMSLSQKFWYLVVNAISASRVFTVYIIFWLYVPAVMAWNVAGSAWWLLAIVALTATDFIDGPIARRFDVTSRLGSVLDHVTDKLCLGTGLIAWLYLLRQAHFGWDGVVFVSFCLLVATVAVEIRVALYNRDPKYWDEGANDKGRIKYAIQGGAMVCGGIGVTWFFHQPHGLLFFTILADLGLFAAIWLAVPSLQEYRQRAKT